MKKIKTEEEAYNMVIDYINATKHNSPCLLATIKRVLRSERIIDLIFSRPDIFKLESEFKHIPDEMLTEKILIKYILINPNCFISLDETLLTLPVMVAFEFAKRRLDFLARYNFGMSAPRVLITKKYSKCSDYVSSICDKLPSKYNDEEILIYSNRAKYVEKVSNEIIEYCDTIDEEIQEVEEYKSKYDRVDFNTNDKKVFILVSGCPDSGKTTFSRILSSKIKDSTCFDSDILLERDLLGTPLNQLVDDKYRVVVFSDLYADCFFTEEELGDSIIINILMKPVSIEKMYQNSKYMKEIPFDQYKKYEIEPIEYKSLTDAICVTNEYNNKILMQDDVVLDEILNRINISQSNDQNYNDESIVTLKKILSN